MGNSQQRDQTLILRQLMQKVGISSFRQLYDQTGISAHTIHKLRSGKLDTLQWQALVKISGVLDIPVVQLINIFSPQFRLDSDNQELVVLQQEYRQLQQQLERQRDTLQSEFQSQSLQTIESFLTYFPAAKYAAMNNPAFPVSKIFPLLQSIDQLISQWGVTIIGEIGTKIAYDPRWHQLIEGTANPNELVTVRYLGYRQDAQLIFRAKVSN
jgi:DNA-binding Xre family transcriptional regulator